MRRVRLGIRGLVQGVSFRYYAREEARRLGVSGWIRNREDGDVEAVAEGDDEALETFVGWCRRGPPGARVHAVERQELAGARRYRDFGVVHEAPE